ncbi:hypothetical protein R6Y90_16035 [Alteromonas macleodii]|uniref:hypothetical protein n=1 Tax=Alteromonas macleodii TaxID=28108 RepID=UPI002980CC1E|nr:hypothetical protein [Alteromonas macleodii]MDW5286473.1 hypothetical protein [Alteromonas macleodii]
MVVLCALDPFELIQRIFQKSSLKFVHNFDDLQRHKHEAVFSADSENVLLDLLSADMEVSLVILLPPTELLISQAFQLSSDIVNEHVSETLSRALKLQTQNRARISFISLSGICNNESDFKDIKLQLDVAEIVEGMDSHKLLMSNYLLNTNSELKKLDKRIKASFRFPYRDILPTLDVREVMQRKQQEQIEKEQLQSENAKLVDEVFAVQEALEANVSRLRVEEDRYSELQEQSKSNEKLLRDSIDEQCKALDFTIESLLVTQEELETQVTARAALSLELEQVNKAHRNSDTNLVKLREEFEKLEERYNREHAAHEKLKEALKHESSAHEKLKEALKHESSAHEKLKEAHKHESSAHEKLKEAHKHESSAHEKLKEAHKLESAKYTKNIAKLEQQLSAKAKELKEKGQSLTLLEKQKDRELAKLETRISEQDDSAHALRADLANYKVATMSPYWRFSRKIEKLSHVLDRKATDRNQQLLDASLIYTSDLFDAIWYLETYKDVAAVGIDPVQHYLSSGATEGRNPSSRFDGNWYLQRYPDVAETGMNPLLHYIKHGREEGRSISPLMISHEKRKSK